MTAHDALAILPGNHDFSGHADVVSVCADDMTVLLVARPYRAMLLPQPRKAVVQAAAARQRLLEAAMPFGTVLPFRPGVTLGPAQVPPFIRSNRRLLDQLVQRFAGCVQFQITVSWRAEDVLTRFRDSPELGPVFAEGQTTPQMLEAAVTALATRLGAEMEAILGVVSQEVIRLPCATDMLMNATVLVPAAHGGRLDQAVEKLDAIWTEGLQIQQIGPAPAASFASLDARPVSRADVVQSQHLLGVNPSADAATILAARRRMLMQRPSQAAAIRSAADMALAAVESGSDPCLLCSVISEDQAAPANDLAQLDKSA